jgi:hypothetical protein
MTYFEVGFQNYLHNKILQHLFDSNLKIFNFQMKYFKNILRTFQTTQSPKQANMAPLILFAPLSI